MSTALLSKVAAVFQPDRLAGLVTEGRVHCPINGRDVDVDRCLGCRSFEKTIAGQAGQVWLRCKAFRSRPIYHL
jgi:hypothetical protein